VYADPNGNSSGKSYVVFGKANNSAINLRDIANANNPTGGFQQRIFHRYGYL
jgi:Neuraminidase (sialidase)